MNKRRRFKAKRRRRDARIMQIATSRDNSQWFWSVIEQRRPSWFEREDYSTMDDDE